MKTSANATAPKYFIQILSLTWLPSNAAPAWTDELEPVTRQQTKLAILFLDLNGFKAINDELGHESGDILLLTVAKRIPQAIRERDYAGRLSGDEFLVILQDISSLENAQMVAGKLLDLICQACALKDQVVTISASIGIGISLYPDDATEINELIHQVDQKMYRAKQIARSDKQPYANRIGANPLDT